MGKLEHNMKAVKVVMMVALLFCLFLCPHGASADLEVCAEDTQAMVCHDVCGCQSHGPHHECALDSLHSHNFIDNTSRAICPDFIIVGWFRAVFTFNASQLSFRFFDLVAQSCSHTFAVRHLDAIILRV